MNVEYQSKVEQFAELLPAEVGHRIILDAILLAATTLFQFHRMLP